MQYSESDISQDHRPTRDHRPPAYLRDYVCPLNNNHNALVMENAAPTDPRTLKSALKDPRWVGAMREELDALHKNQTWTLVPRPTNTNIIGSKWVFRLKYKEDGSIERFKARLVAKGFSQISGLDYDESFSLVVKPTTIRLVIPYLYLSICP